jgi:uncharacterized DUF497 family protein
VGPLRPYPASRAILAKIEAKHGVAWNEVVEMFLFELRIHRGPRDVYGERRYRAEGRTAAGRALMAVFTVPQRGWAKVITARPLGRKGRRQMRRRNR